MLLGDSGQTVLRGFPGLRVHGVSGKIGDKAEKAEGKVASLGQ